MDSAETISIFFSFHKVQAFCTLWIYTVFYELFIQIWSQICRAPIIRLPINRIIKLAGSIKDHVFFPRLLPPSQKKILRKSVFIFRFSEGGRKVGYFVPWCPQKEDPHPACVCSAQQEESCNNFYVYFYV